MGASPAPFGPLSSFKQSGASLRQTIADAFRTNQRQNLVATKGYVMDGTGGGAAESNPTHMNTRMCVRIGPSNVSNLRLVLANLYVSTFDTDGPAAVTLRIAMEIGVGSSLKSFPITYKGSPTIPIDPKSSLIYSDPIGVTIPANTLCMFRYEVVVGSGDTVVCGYLVHGGALLDGDPTASTSENCIRGTNSSLVYSTGSFSGTAVEGYCALGIIGDAEKPMPSFAIIGDSIARGSGDSVSNNMARGQGVGYIARGLRLTNNVMLPFTNLARGGLAMNAFNTGFYGLENYRRLAMLGHVTHAIFHIGTNDLTTTGQTLEDMQSRYQTTWALAKRRGVKVIQCTILPRTNAANTSVVNSQFASGGLRDQLNAWFPTQVGTAIDGVIDANTVLEDSNNPGFWVAGMTDDGVHMNTTGHQAGAAVVRAWAEALIAA